MLRYFYALIEFYHFKQQNFRMGIDIDHNLLKNYISSQ